MLLRIHAACGGNPFFAIEIGGRTKTVLEASAP